MPTLITINVKNMSKNNKDFFFFQQPAVYTGGPQVYSNSLFQSVLFPFKDQGSILTFTLLLQFYAGVQQQVGLPVVGQPSGQLAARQPIGLTPAAGGAATNNTTTMTNKPSLGLSKPVSTPDVQPGAFRIVTPVFDPALQQYNAGSAVQATNGGIILSNFVSAQPNMKLDCQPILKFYVQTGEYIAGTVMNFSESSVSAALCDATPGYDTFDVTYNADGTWTVKPKASARLLRERGVTAPVELNAEIRNEAGTATVARGHAANFLSPVVIDHIDNTGAIRQYGE